MMASPRPTPTALKLLRGNPGKRRLNESEPKPNGKLPPCPDHLSQKAREAWAQFGNQLETCGIATSLDATALELLCGAYATYLDAAEKTSQHGAVWIEKGESKIPKFAYSPYWSVMNRSFKQVKEMLMEFGMTPSSRSRVNAELQEAKVMRRQRA